MTHKERDWGLFRLCLVFSLLLLDQIIITWCLRVCFIIILVFSGTFQRQISPNGSFLPANYSHPVRSRPTIYSQEPPPIIVIITLEIDRHRLFSSRALSCLDTHYNSSLSLEARKIMDNECSGEMDISLTFIQPQSINVLYYYYSPSHSSSSVHLWLCLLCS